MRTKGIPLISVLAIALFLSSCGPSKKAGRMVEFSCDHAIGMLNYANNDCIGPNENGKFALYLSGPSLFCVFTDLEEDDESFLYMYLPEDGREIDLKIDGDLLYVNGSVQSISLTQPEPRNFLDWFQTADETKLQTIRFIIAENDYPEEIEAILSANPDVTVFFEDLDILTTESVIYQQKPRIFMGYSSTNTESIRQEIMQTDFSELRIMMIDGDDPNTLESLAKKDMPKLHRIILVGEEGAEKVLEAFPHVKALTIQEDLIPIPNLAEFEHLEELHLICDSSETAIDFNQLPNPKALRILTINYDGNYIGLERLTELEYLNPAMDTVSDEELTHLLSTHPRLVFLNLMYATLDSLESLKSATQLEGITLGKFKGDAKPDLAPLAKLKHLHYIGLSGDLGEKEEIVAEIRKVCPQAVIYHHDEFCLGSGWLTLILPLLLILLLFKKTRQGA